MQETIEHFQTISTSHPNIEAIYRLFHENVHIITKEKYRCVKNAILVKSEQILMETDNYALERLVLSLVEKLL